MQVTEAHEPCAGQIAGLKAHLARLDAELYAEIEKEHALAEQLASEKLKEAERLSKFIEVRDRQLEWLTHRGKAQTAPFNHQPNQYDLTSLGLI